MKAINLPYESNQLTIFLDNELLHFGLSLKQQNMLRAYTTYTYMYALPLQVNTLKIHQMAMEIIFIITGVINYSFFQQLSKCKAT